MDCVYEERQVSVVEPATGHGWPDPLEKHFDEMAWHCPAQQQQKKTKTR